MTTQVPYNGQQFEYKPAHYSPQYRDTTQGTSPYPGHTDTISQVRIMSMAPDTSQHRQPRSLEKAPWLGLLALVVVLASMVACIILVLHANDKAIDSWPMENRPIQLSVVLAIPLAMGTAALRTAFREGTTVSFWVKMQKNPSLRKAHQQWAHGWSSLDALLGLRHPNKVTVPSILMIGIVVVAPLFQRAVEIHMVSEFVPKTFTVAVSPEQFNQPTAYYMTRANAVSALTSNFSGVVQDYTNRNPITGLSVKDCHGTCSGVLTGPGFDVSCTRLGTNYNLSFDNLNPGDTTQIGYITIAAEGPQTPNVIRIVTAYKGSPDTKGKLTTTNCTLRSAQVKYPFTYINGTTTLNGTSSSVDGTVNRTVSLLTVDREAPGLNRAPSLLGGIAYAINELYASNVTLYYSGQLAVQGSGPMPYTYMSSNDAALGTSNVTWNDPTPAVLNAVRELSFRAAIGFADGEAQQTVEGTQKRITAKYQLRTTYLGIPVAILAIQVGIVAVLFVGFNRLHRSHTMSPLDIARGFAAPLLKNAHPYDHVSKIVRELGHYTVESFRASDDETRGMASCEM